MDFEEEDEKSSATNSIEDKTNPNMSRNPTFTSAVGDKLARMQTSHSEIVQNTEPLKKGFSNVHKEFKYGCTISSLNSMQNEENINSMSNNQATFSKLSKFN